jgi:hypothetical protein
MLENKNEELKEKEEQKAEPTEEPKKKEEPKEKEEQKTESKTEPKEKEESQTEPKETSTLTKIDFTLKDTEGLETPEGIDMRIYNFLMRYYQFREYEFPTWNSWCQVLDMYTSMQKVYTGKLGVLHVHRMMVNYNYDLQMKIKRFELQQMINLQDNGFRATYDNSISHTVTVILPYDPKFNQIPEYLRIREEEKKAALPENILRDEKRKKRNVKPKERKVSGKKNHAPPRHNFLVYRTGRVTFSTNGNYESMKNAYDAFNSMVEELRNDISRPDV